MTELISKDRLMRKLTDMYDSAMGCMNSDMIRAACKFCMAVVENEPCAMRLDDNGGNDHGTEKEAGETAGT